MSRLSNGLAVIGLCALLAITGLTLFDIVLRSGFVFFLRDSFPAFDTFVLDSGIDGLSDLYAPLGIVAVAFCFPSMAANRSAIAVDFLADAAPWRLREAMVLFGDLCLLAMLGLMAWWVSDYTVDSWKSGETTWLLSIPRWPAWTAAAAAIWMAAAIQANVTVAQATRALARSEPPREEGRTGGVE